MNLTLAIINLDSEIVFLIMKNLFKRKKTYFNL